MERKKYLLQCQRNAVFTGNFHVQFAGEIYEPLSYHLKFDKNGNAVHIAELLQREKRCYMYADLDEVEEIEDERIYP